MNMDAFEKEKALEIITYSDFNKNIIYRYILTQAIRNTDAFCHLIDKIVQYATTSENVKKILITQIIKKKIECISSFENKRDLVTVENFKIPCNWIFTEAFINNNLKYFKENLNPIITDINSLNDCINSIFVYLKQENQKINYDSYVGTLTSVSSTL